MLPRVECPSKMRRKLWWRNWRRGVGWCLLLWSRVIDGHTRTADDDGAQANCLGSGTRIDKVDKSTAVGKLDHLNFANVVQRIDKVSVGFKIAADPDKGAITARCIGLA